jgi:hypothetical protein
MSSEPLTPEQRKTRASLASLTRWSREEDRTAATAPALAGFLNKFEKQVDPDNKLDPVVRAQRADAAFRAHMARLAYASSKARAARRKKGKPADGR